MNMPPFEIVNFVLESVSTMTGSFQSLGDIYKDQGGR